MLCNFESQQWEGLRTCLWKHNIEINFGDECMNFKQEEKFSLKSDVLFQEVAVTKLRIEDVTCCQSATLIIDLSVASRRWWPPCFRLYAWLRSQIKTNFNILSIVAVRKIWWVSHVVCSTRWSHAWPRRLGQGQTDNPCDLRHPLPSGQGHLHLPHPLSSRRCWKWASSCSTSKELCLPQV